MRLLCQVFGHRIRITGVDHVERQIVLGCTRCKHTLTGSEVMGALAAPPPLTVSDWLIVALFGAVSGVLATLLCAVAGVPASLQFIVSFVLGWQAGRMAWVYLRRPTGKVKR